MSTAIRKTVKVAITGAAGQIGYALLFRLASGQVFGPDVAVELQLLELEAALPALTGVAMELDDCAFPLLKKVTVTANLDEAMRGVNYALLIGSVPRKAGMERKDLLAINGQLFIAQGRAIAAQAADDVRVFVVGNPCNTNALIAMHHANPVPKARFFAMTMLDENRARAQLANKAGVPVSEVQGVYIWGNHSATQFPDFAQATIQSHPVSKVITDSNWLQETFVSTVQQRGAAVIKARGASSAASAANAVVDSVYRLSHDTAVPFSVACCSQGEYGIDSGLIFSFPCRTVKGHVQIVEGLVHNAWAQQKLQATLSELREERAAVEALGLLK